MVEHTVELSSTLISQLSSSTGESGISQLRVKPTNAVYVIVTSGSTGKPKMIVVEHSAVCTHVVGHNRVYSLGKESRVLQFSSFVFDVSLGEILETLALGGTLCVPSETERLQDASGFINRTGVNTALLTSSFARTIRPSDVPGLKMLILVGEAPSKDVLDIWCSRVTVINAYGPAETVIFCTSHVYESASEAPTTIGRPFGSSCWIVEVDNHQRLAPIGCVGELMVLGQVARGYLNDPDKTSASFIKDVDWLPSSSKDELNKFYKTGDLAKYNFDGTIEYLGRQDTQVKVRGYRVELGAIEASIKEALPHVEHVAVDVLRREAGEALVAFVSFLDLARVENGGSTNNLADELLPVDIDMRSAFVRLADDLKTMLPSYMVPGHFLPFRRMPFVAAMKLDRKRLRDLAGVLSQDQLAEFATATRIWVAPTTEVELRLRDVWARVLDLEQGTIGKNDSFLQIGGDSISAIQMVTVAHEAGLVLTIKDIFDDPRLSKVALQASETENKDELQDIQPFSLLPHGTVERVKAQLREQCRLSKDQVIQDAYPCTSLQEGLMALAMKQPGSYMAKLVYRIPPNVDLARFKAAWRRTVELCTALRTRIITGGGVATQAVIAGDFMWEHTEGTTLRSIMKAASKLNMGYGSRLCRYGVVEESSAERHFILTIHHAIFDGWSLSLIFTTLGKFYDESDTSTIQSFPSFIRYATSLDSETAGDYWTKQLHNARKATFPPPSSSVHSENISRIMKTTVPFPRNTESSITKATILRAAWAIVLARYCDSDDVCFASTVSGRHAPVLAIDKAMGPTVATVPVRIQLDRQQTVSAMLRQVQTQATEMVAYEQFGLRNISKLGPEAKDACDATSLMVIQPFHSMTFGNMLGQGVLSSANVEGFGVEEALESYFSYPLVIQCMTFDEHVEFNITYHTNVLPEARIEALSNHFAQVVHQLQPQDYRQLHALTLTGEWDLRQASRWNVAEMAPMPMCMHDMVRKQVARNPAHEAIAYSGGSLSYAQLQRISTQLASHLSQLGVGPETMVPICFEKSVWAIVAMFGVMIAGGAFVPIDPSHPVSRRQALVKQIDANVMLVSPFTAESCNGMVQHTVQLSDAMITRLPPPDIMVDDQLRLPGPANAAYVIFTSGTTGKAKTIVAEHSALCTSVNSQGIRLSVDTETRFLQFSSYVFDASITEIWTTLAFGGTVCVPTEAERLHDIPSFITNTRVNTALLTPSFVNTFSPSEVNTLKTLVLGGEAPTKAILETWLGRVRLMNAYGPAEGVVMCAAYEYRSMEDSPTTVGSGTYGPLWIVDPDDHQQLAPIGCTGELLIQGHGLARGYAGDEATTARSFIKRVDWLPQTSTTHQPRFYKTGDLVRYRTDGMLEYLGRKDTQVKIRGQRVELGAIEASIQQVLPNVEHVAVEVVRWEAREALVAFINFRVEASGEKNNAADDLSQELLPIEEERRTMLVMLADKLKTMLPPYMVPARSETIARARGREKNAPVTELEKRLQEVWAGVLHLPDEAIGRDDSFLRIGGDSISAIQMVTAAREAGLAVTVKDVFDDPRLSSVAACAVEIGDDNVTHEIEPFSLLPVDEVGTIKTQLREQCMLSEGQTIEDAYPCTGLQEGLMALAVKQPGSYMAKHVYRIPQHIDIARFMMAWERTVELCGSLRTRIATIRDAAVQALIMNDGAWEPTAGLSLKTFMSTTSKLRMGYGSRLCRFGIIEESAVERYFVMIIHHAVFDGWSLKLMMTTFQNAYHGASISAVQPYAGFIEYTMNVDTQKASEYWIEQLHDAKRAAFPEKSRRQGTAVATCGIRATLAFPKAADSSITRATMLRTAWAVVLARYCDTADVCFGTTVSGRHAPVFGVDKMAGPAVATVPVRVHLEGQQSVAAMLRKVQAQASEMVAFEQFGLQRISRLSPEVKEACDFSSLLVIQPSAIFEDGGDAILAASQSKEYSAEEGLSGYFSYPLVLQCFMRDDQVDLHITYDSAVIAGDKLNALTTHFDHVLKQLLAQDERPLDEVSLSGEWDLQRAVEWNGAPPEPVSSCVHQLVETQAKQRADAPAIQAWDGEFTYGQLNAAANRLAHLLVDDFAVGIGDLVHVCFEKSAWFFVAMLAINKAGAAWVPLDPSHPSQRLQQVVQQTGAKLALTSPEQSSKCADLVAQVVEVTAQLDQQLAAQGRSDVSGPTCEVGSGHAAYVLFTSGSTGTPKGLVMEHGAVCTSQRAIGERLGLTSEVRMLQFAAFVFDLSIGEIVGPLIAGACICVPSEHTRMNGLKEFMVEKAINWAFQDAAVCGVRLRPVDR
nr:nonribosomal peptide synthetase vlms [Quercus suber]